MRKPKATSTPTLVPSLRCRRGIREKEVSPQSTIDSLKDCDALELSSSSPHNSPNVSPKPRRRNRSRQRKRYECDNLNNSEEDEDDQEESDATTNDIPDRRYVEKILKPSEELKKNIKGIDKESLNNKENNGSSLIYVFSIAVFMGLIVISIYFLYGNNQVSLPLNKMCNDLLGQTKDFCTNIEVNIREIRNWEQPRTILLLYEEKSSNTLHKILKKVSSHASCFLNECSNNPIIINGETLNTSQYINDYGKIMSKYTEPLRHNVVMIVNNLEKVPGAAARGFHSFCDEYNPVVNKALFLFTIKLDKLPSNNPDRFIEYYLSNVWNDIGKDDQFYPLFARISSTVLMVQPEREQ